MTDDTELAGIDPVDWLDREAARIDLYLSAASDEVWVVPSRCAGWSVRDVLGHLASTEAYHQACLNGEVKAFIRQQVDRGGTDLATINDLGIADYADRTPQEILAEWRRSNAETRRGFRARGNGQVDTSVGTYPCRWQAFHVAGELATHADDMFVPVAPAERDARLAWRVRLSRFALAEEKPGLEIAAVGGRTRIRGDGLEVELDDDEMVEAVSGRLRDDARFDAAERALLSTTP